MIKLTILLLLFCVFGSVLNSNLSVELQKTAVSAYNNFLKTFPGSVATKETNYRMIIFNKQFNQVNEFNKNTDNSYEKGINQFSSFTREELQNIYLKPKKKLTITVSAPPQVMKTAVSAVTKDWSITGATSVKDQGKCGSCWAFSAIAIVESAFLLIQKKTYDLSEQQLVSCSKTSLGCDGGDNLITLQKEILPKALATEAAYPYTSGADGLTGVCRNITGTIKIKSVVAVNPTGTCGPLTSSLTINQFDRNLQQGIQSRPMGISADASDWFPYSKGIFNSCAPKQINHDILLVGMNVTNKSYKIKNQWGTKWGENGYMRITYSKKNCNGILQCPLPYVTV